MCSVICRIAGERDLDDVFAIRARVFCREQGMFAESDRDEWDRVSVHLVAEVEGETVGTVRLYPQGEGVWIGGRLAVLPGKRGGLVGSRLVERAVQEAAARGAVCFRASIQAENEKLFHRLGWRSVGPRRYYRGVEHREMEAPLGQEAACGGWRAAG